MKNINGVQVFSELAEIIAPVHTALLVVDVQNDLVLPDGWFAQNGKDISGVQSIIEPVADLVRSARAAGVLLIFMEQTTLPRNASDPPGWLYFKTRDGRQRTDYALRGTWGNATVDEIDVQPEDIRLEKFRPSSFHHTPLDDILRARAIQSVVVCGTITQGCVQATMMDASFHNYYTVLARDCVSSYSRTLHGNALEFMSSRYDLADRVEIKSIWANSTAMQQFNDGAVTDV